MYQNELYHHGVKGQRWGVRRYQDYYGSREKKRFQARRNLKTAGANLYRVDDKTKDKHRAYRNDVIKQSMKEINKAEKILGKKEVDQYLAAGYRDQSMKSAAIKSAAITGASIMAVAGITATFATSPYYFPSYSARALALMKGGQAATSAANLALFGANGYRGATARQRISKMTGRKFKY